MPTQTVNAIGTDPHCLPDCHGAVAATVHQDNMDEKNHIVVIDTLKPALHKWKESVNLSRDEPTKPQ